MKLYKIRDWDRLYETHDTRKLKNLRWIAIPNKFDGIGFKRIAKQKDSTNIFTAWILLLELASKCEPRGTLIRDNIPLSPGDAGDVTGFPGEIFVRALSFLSSIEIGWIDCIDKDLSENLPDSPDESGESPDKPGTPPAVRKERKERKEDTRSGEPPDPRFVLFRDRFFEYFKTQNGEPYIPSKADFGIFAGFIKKAPDITLEQWTQAIRNCFHDSFHKKNMSLGYVAGKYSTLINVTATPGGGRE